jgi:ribonuclease HI
MRGGRTKIYFDGGCRPNPGCIETAVVARGVSYYRPDCGYGNSHDGEWIALLDAADVALSIGVRDVLMLGDSAAIVSQANGTTKCRSEASRGHYARFQAVKCHFDSIRIRHIGRHQNLAGIALSKARRV